MSEFVLICLTWVHSLEVKPFRPGLLFICNLTGWSQSLLFFFFFLASHTDGNVQSPPAQFIRIPPLINHHSWAAAWHQCLSARISQQKLITDVNGKKNVAVEALCTLDDSFRTFQTIDNYSNKCVKCEENKSVASFYLWSDLYVVITDHRHICMKKRLC